MKTIDEEFEKSGERHVVDLQFVLPTQEQVYLLMESLRRNLDVPDGITLTRVKSSDPTCTQRYQLAVDMVIRRVRKRRWL